MLAAAAAQAREDVVPQRLMRWDIMLDVPMWPALADLQPVASGSFDSAGLAISGSLHFPFRTYENSELLAGADLSIGATDSGIQGLLADVSARQFYIGASLKWLFGKQRNLSLDGGLGYHEADIAQVGTTWVDSVDFEHWGSSAVGGFVGATWDVGAGRPHKSGGLSLGLRVFYTDFGTVYDQDLVGFTPVLGRDAGDLNGPMYVLRIGYSGW
jgi:hypothetical protein